jgi:hypothetical protein
MVRRGRVPLRAGTPGRVLTSCSSQTLSLAIDSPVLLGKSRGRGFGPGTAGDVTTPDAPHHIVPGAGAEVAGVVVVATSSICNGTVREFRS